MFITWFDLFVQFAAYYKLILSFTVHCCSKIYFALNWCIYCPSCSARTTYTVVCDQIANKSFVLLNASVLGEYREKTSLRSASQAQRQDSVTGGGGGINKLGEHKNFNTSNPRVRTKKQWFSSQNSAKSGVKTKKRSSSRNMRGFLLILGWREKKLFNSKTSRVSTNSGVKLQKKRVFITKFAKKTVLDQEFWDDNQYWESQASNCTPVAPSLLLSLGHNPHLGGPRVGGHKSWGSRAVI